MLKNGIKIAILLLFILPATPSKAQQVSEKKLERYEARYERKARKDYEKRRKQVVKHRYSIQTPEVRERMKESRKKAERFNRGKKECFLKTLFGEKRKKQYKRKKRLKK